MRLGGIQKVSLIDYPGEISTVLFTQGCPFRCHFCHNPSLVIPTKKASVFTEEDFFSYLDTRKNKIDAVVISGGEPTIQKDLKRFIKDIKKRNLLIKLDTSGITPHVIEELLEEKLLNYIAMDIKTSIEKYDLITNIKTNKEAIKESISLIINSKIDYEFRTTIVNDLHEKNDILNIFKLIKGAKQYVLQKFNNKIVLNKKYANSKTFSHDDLNNLVEISKEYSIETCFWR